MGGHKCPPLYYMTNNDLINIGFKEIPHFTVGNDVIYYLSRDRHISATCVGTPNEMLWLCSSDSDDSKKITDLICIHNYDYDGYITLDRVKDLLKFFENGH